MSDGRLAVMLTYSAEECQVAADKYTAAAQYEPCISTDLWSAVSNLFPHKVSVHIAGVNSRRSHLWKPTQVQGPACAHTACLPHLCTRQVPHSPFLAGLTLLDRRILQLVIEVDRAGGARAVDRLTLVLAVDASFTA